MSCNNNNRYSGLNDVLDLNVKYTGCDFTIGDITIKQGDNIRKVLDAILRNLGLSTSGSNLWFGIGAPNNDIPAKDRDFYLNGEGEIWTFDEEDGMWENTLIVIGGGTSEWGDITGDISAQNDLVSLVESNKLISGDGINVNSENKIELGEVFQNIVRLLLVPSETQVFILGTKDDTTGLQNTSKQSISFDNKILTLGNVDGSSPTITLNNNSSFPADKELRINEGTYKGILRIYAGTGEINGAFSQGVGYTRYNGSSAQDINGAIIISDNTKHFKLVVDGNTGALSTIDVTTLVNNFQI